MFYSNSLNLKINTKTFLMRGDILKWNFAHWVSLFFISAFLFIWLFYTFLIGNNISKNYEVNSLKSKITILQGENQKLSLKLSGVKSLEILEEFAGENNLVDVERVSYIKITQPILVAK